MKAIIFTVLLASNVLAKLSGKMLKPKHLKCRGDRFARDDLVDDPDTTSGEGVFQQLLDHNDPSLGTFNMSFRWNSEFWTGPGAPVVFHTPGEYPASEFGDYVNNQSLMGMIGQEIGGALVLMEHRYWGDSSPFSVLTTENLTYLTIENAIKDTTYFARNVELPFDLSGATNAPNAPWVFTGVSYSGALSAWTQALDPGTFWAYHASSAAIEAIYDFWTYFKPIEEGMPQNCSSDVIKVIEYMDGILMSDDTAAKADLKAKFGLGSVEHDDDFMVALESAVWEYQSNDFDVGYSHFWEFCDSVENVGPLYSNATNSSIPGPEGVGLEKALEGYAKFMREVNVPGSCSTYGYPDWTDDYDLGCLDSYNASIPFYTDTSLTNPYDRTWSWILCNEPLAFWPTGAPEGTTTLVSRLVTADYWQRQCALYFPEPGTFGSAEGKTVDTTNAITHGWDLAGNTTRLIWITGQYDPWKHSTVSSDYKPGGPFLGTPDAPVLTIPGGTHGSDMYAVIGEANEGVKKVQNEEIAQIAVWVDEFYTMMNKKRPKRHDG